MNNYPLVMTLGFGSLLAFSLFFIFFKVIHWGGKMAALATAASMLLVYIPLVIRNWAGIDVFAIHFAFFMMIPYGLGIITTVQEERRALAGNDNSKKGMHWIPALIVVFLMMVAVVDSIIISFATTGLGGGLAQILLPKGMGEDVGERISSQFTGAVSNDLQDEEKKFDDYVDKLRKQKERGWAVSGGWDDSPLVDTKSVFRLKVKDRSGLPISNANVSSEFRRASDMKFDRLYTLTEESGGVYSVPVSLPLAGCWTMKILVNRGGDEHEIKGQTAVSTLIDGKRVSTMCIDGEPEVNDIITD